MQFEVPRQEDPGGELHTWRTVIVPMFGPLWVLLPFLVWLCIFGSTLMRAGGVDIDHSTFGVLIVLSFAGWAALAGGRLMSACQSWEGAFPWSPVLLVSLILFLQMLIGTIFFAMVMYGMLKEWDPVSRAVVGAVVVGFGWMGWSGITPYSRRLALATLRWLRRKI